MRRALVTAASLVLAALVPAAPSGAAPAHTHPQGRNDSMSFSQPLPAVGNAANARMAATEQLKAHAAEWGLDPADLSYNTVAVSAVSGRTVRFTQSINGVPVLASLVSMTLGKSGELLAVTTDTSDAPAESVQLSAGQARAAIVSATSSSATVANLTLAIADRRLLSELPTGSHYVWTAIVSGWKPVPEQVFLNDASGAVVSHASTVRDAVDTTPLVCDGKYASVDVYATTDFSSYGLCSASAKVTASSQLVSAATPMADADFTRIGPAMQATIDYYRTYLGTDINRELYLGNIAPHENYGYTYGGSGLASAQSCYTSPSDPACTPRISAFLNACFTIPGAGCPYASNAMWTAWPPSSGQASQCASGYCSAVFFGAGWAVDDVVAHEMTHGVTQLEFTTTANAETNALSEAYSDFIAEPVDQLTVDPGEAPDPTWGFGEDIGRRPGDYKRYSTDLGVAGFSYIGPARTLAQVRSGEYQTIGSGWDRNADAHYNLGPADRFAWLIANGGTQGGWTIRGLGTEPVHSGNANGLCDTVDECTGMIRMTQLVMTALPNLTAAATYFDFGRAIIQACATLTTNAVAGFTTTSCGQVKNALIATRIWKLTVNGLTPLSARHAGVTSTVRAQVLTSTGAPAPGIRVSLQVRRRSSLSWRTYSTRTSDSNGRVRFSAIFASSNYYRVVTKSSTSTPSASSVVRRVIVN
jgi:Zn-dependent metalloprotease